MSPIDPTVPASLSDAAQHLSVFAAQTAVPPIGAEDRVWQAVQARISAGDLGPDLPPQSAASVGGLRVIAWGWRTWLLASIGVAGLVGAAVAWPGQEAGRDAGAGQDHATVAQASVIDEAGVATPSATAGAGSHAQEVSDPEDSRTDLVPNTHAEGLDTAALVDAPHGGETAGGTDADHGASSDSTPRKSQKPRAGGEDPLALEVDGLGQARQALQAGDPKKALKVLDRLDRSVGRGTMGDERDLTRVTALCKLEQVEAARKVASALRARAPASAVLRKLDTSCAGQ